MARADYYGAALKSFVLAFGESNPIVKKILADAGSSGSIRRPGTTTIGRCRSTTGLVSRRDVADDRTDHRRARP